MDISAIRDKSALLEHVSEKKRVIDTIIQLTTTGKSCLELISKSNTANGEMAFIQSHFL